MNTVTTIVTIICGTLVLLVAMILVAAVVASHGAQKRMDKFEKDFFKEDDDNGR